MEGAEVSEKPACGRRLGWVRLAADTREETGQGQGEPLPGAGCIRETGIKPPPIKVVSAAGALRPLGAAGALGPATSCAAEKVRGPEDKLPAFQGCSLLRPRGRHSHRLPLARRSPVGGEAAGTGVYRDLTAPWSRSHCPLPGGFGAQPGSAPTPVLPTSLLATPPSSLGLRQTRLPATRGLARSPAMADAQGRRSQRSEWGHSLRSEASHRERV